MTREEAIQWIKDVWLDAKDYKLNGTDREALGITIEALSQEPCEDAISRREVLEQTHLWSKDEFLRVTNPFDYLRKRINDLPLVTPQQKTGHWILTSDDDGYEYCTCPQCGYQNGENWMIGSHIKYCQECGAKLGVEE